MSGSSPASSYVMGHSDHERRRLALQASVLNPLTRAFLRRAGISAGMRVLDLGCGVGEVSAIAASLVEPHGSVTGIDIDFGALEIARTRARENAYDHVTFQQCPIMDHEPARPYDAVIGRLILVHTPDPVAVLRRAAALVHTGGIVAFQEYDLAHHVPSAVPQPLKTKLMQLFIDLFSRAVPYADIGLRLFSMMQEAGLPAPECSAEYPIDGGPDSPAYEWLAETVRTILPKLEAAGLATAAEIDVDTLAARLRGEAVEARTVFLGPLLLGAFTRKN